MGSGFEAEYRPAKDKAAAVRTQYGRYSRLGSFIEQETAANKAGGQAGSYRQIREAAFECNRELYRRNLILYTFGNASALDREKGVFAIKPSGVSYEKLRPEDMVVVGIDGKVADGHLRPSSDTPTHAVLYRHFPDIRGVVHTHSPYAVAFAQAMRPIPILGTTHADHAWADIPCTPVMSDKAIRGDYEAETGLQIVNAFKNLSYREIEMVLVACHGPFTWGLTPDKAVMNAVMVEELARIAWMTLSLNPKMPGLKKTLIDKHYQRKHGKDAYYGQPPLP
jgi:L-ribulose-5-phosphate 4-epimerase